MQFSWRLFRIGFFLFAVSSNSVMSSLVVPSSLVVVISGGRVEINCSVGLKGNYSATWTYTSSNSSKEANVYAGIDIYPQMKSRYRIDKKISGQHNLIIDSVDLAHAGRYSCISTESESPMNDIHLTVLVSDLSICDANTTDGQDQTNLTIWCSISYLGNATPAFRCTKSNEVLHFTADTTAYETSRMPLTKTFSVKQQLHANDSGVTFKCLITFELSDNYSSGNIYSYTWNYTLYGPVNISIVRYENRLECSAGGNPTPNYGWTHIERNKSTSGFSVFIPNDTFASEKSHSFQCTAANILASKHATIIIQGSSIAKDSGGTQGVFNTALIIGGFILFLLIAAIIIGLWVFHRKRLKDDADARPDVALNTDLNSYEDISLISSNSRNHILDGELPESSSSDGRIIADNAVYSEVGQPNDRSNGSNGGNLGDNSRPLQIPTRGRKNLIGADGTEYADLSEVSPSAHKAQSAQKPAFNRVDVYASIDHTARAPPAPPKL